MRGKPLRGDFALDTSVLVEVALATRGGRKLIELILSGDVTPYTTTLNVTEALYVLCRLLGFEEAEKRINLMIDSGYFNVVSSEKLSRLAARCKCLFPISIVDCHTLALARAYAMPALFYRREKELEALLAELKDWIGSDVFFLSEYLT